MMQVVTGGTVGMVVRAETDATSFDDFYAGTRRGLLAQLYAWCGNMAEAQDCVQEAYARAWQRWSKVSTYDDPAAWVRLVAWRLATNRWRKRRNADRAWSRSGQPPPEREPNPDAVALVAALRRIPAAQREAIVLHHLAGLSVDAIAAQTSTPSGTIKARLARGRDALAKLLAEEETNA